jgi:hypothetical protein
MPQDMSLFETQRGPDTGQLLDEPLAAPQALIGRTVRTAASELVIEDHGPLIGECPQSLKIVAGSSGSAMNEEQRCRPAGTHDPIPNASPGNVYVALSGSRFRTGAGRPGEEEQPQRD